MEDKPNMNVVEATLAVMVKFYVVYLPMVILGMLINKEINGLVYYIAFISFSSAAVVAPYISKEQLLSFTKDKIIASTMQLKITLFLAALGISMFAFVVTFLWSYEDENTFISIYATLYGKNDELLFSGLLLGGILQPIFEEYFFRGKLLNGLLKYGYLPAMIASTVAFVSAHMAVKQIVQLFLVGFCLDVLFIITGEIILPALLHCANNLILIILPAVFKDYMYFTVCIKIGSISLIAALLIFSVSKSIRIEIKTMLSRIFCIGKSDVNKA